MFAGKRAQLWATFNEPEVASLCGHIMGNHPPGKVMHFKDGGRKLCTMLRAHAAAYKAIKAMPGKLHMGAFLSSAGRDQQQTLDSQHSASITVHNVH